MDVIVFVPHLLVLFADEFPFRALGIECRFTFAGDLQTKESALAIALALAAALHLVVLVSRINDVDVVQTAAAHAAHLVANGIFHSISRQLAFEDWFHAETTINVTVFRLHLLVSFRDTLPFCCLWIEARFLCEFEAKHCAFAFALTSSGAHHFVVLWSVYRPDNQIAGPLCAKLIAKRILYLIDRDFVLQDRFYAKTFIIEFLRPMFDFAFVIFVRDIPRDIIAGIFRAFEHLTITAAFAAGIGRRTGNELFVVAFFNVSAFAAFAKFERQGGR